MKLTKVNAATARRRSSPNVNGPGKLSLSGKGVAPRSVRRAGAGIAKLKVVATGKARKTLLRTAKAKVRIAVKFRATEGSVVKTFRALTLRRKP